MGTCAHLFETLVLLDECKHLPLDFLVSSLLVCQLLARSEDVFVHCGRKRQSALNSLLWH